MAFGNPMWLWGLTGLAVPIAIHLLSRKEGTVIRIGSIRHLKDTNTQQFKSIRLNEIVLLALRSLLILILTLYLSDLKFTTSSKQKWMVIDAGIKSLPKTKQLADSLASAGYNVYSQKQESSTPKNYWALAEELQRKGIDDVVILSSFVIEQFKGKRVAAPSGIKWISVSPTLNPYLVSAVRTTNASLSMREAVSENGNTNFVYKSVGNSISGSYRTESDSIEVSTPDSVTVTLVWDKEFEYDKKILVAALKAIDDALPASRLNIKETFVDQATGQNNGMLFWLSTTRAPSSEKVILIAQNDAREVIQQTKKNEWVLTKRLTEEIALDENLAVYLARILFPDNNAEQIITLKDQRIMPEQMMWSKAGTGGTGEISASQSAEKILVILFLLTLLTERIVAYKRNQ